MKSSTYLNNNTGAWTSILKKLRNANKVSTEAETVIGDLTLEELIAIKLELSFSTLSTPIYGLPIWENLEEIVREAVLTTALSITQTKMECARFLGMNYLTLKKLIEHYNIYNVGDPQFKQAKKRKEARRLRKIARKTKNVKEFDFKEQYESPTNEK